MSNASFNSHMIKIGMSLYNPKQRRIDLYTTGVPLPFKLEYYAFVKNYEEVEKKVHSRLHKYRVSESREFFNCSIDFAIENIKEIAEVINQLNHHEYAKQRKIEERRTDTLLKKQRKETMDRIQKEDKWYKLIMVAIFIYLFYKLYMKFYE